jgi:hypothetical protein
VTNTETPDPLGKPRDGNIGITMITITTMERTATNVRDTRPRRTSMMYSRERRGRRRLLPDVSLLVSGGETEY